MSLSTDFAGRRGPLFWLALKTSLLTVLTLGFYRFWMKTRLRRYYWSAIRPGGLPLEYVGLPTEKLLGFLIAVVFLAFYIGIVNLILMFASFAVFHGNVFAYGLSFAGIVPILFFAQYRARRYILARTRWRGIRFGLEPGAWGYAGRALWHWALTLLTLGLLWPRKTFWLEKYLTDRTHFGSQPLTQEGRWTMLIRPFLPLALGAGASLIVALAAAGGATGGLIVLPVSIPLAVLGFAHYQVASFRRLAAAKRAGPLRFDARPRTLRVLRIYILGWLGIGLTLGALLFGFFTVLFGLMEGIYGSDGLPADPFAVLQAMPTWFAFGVGLMAYFSFFILYGVLIQIFLTLPLTRHYAETLTLHGTEGLPKIRQRGRDEFAEAEGFADALDVGAAI